MEFGQKIIPMYSNEASNYKNIEYSVWRELYISNLCAELVINNISPSFSIIESWFLIQNSHASLFDNIAMYDKHAHAKIAHKISEDIFDVNKYTYNNNNKRNGFINEKFGKLSNKLINSVNYIEEKLDLSDVSICFQMEYLGRTWKDMPYLALTVDRSQITDLFSNYNVFAKIMFDYIYALLCMNVKVGILHGDLHLNNATFYKVFDIERDPKGKKLDNPLVVYILNDGNKKSTYYNNNVNIRYSHSRQHVKSPSPNFWRLCRCI